MVEVDEKGAVLRDLASRNGTKVSGRPVTAVQLADGDLIVAGETRFLVKIVTPKTEPVVEAPVIEQVPLTRTRGSSPCCVATSSRSTRCSTLLVSLCLKVLFEAKEQHLSLFEGPQGAQLGHSRPSGAPAG